MHILAISTMNFYGNKVTMVRNTAKKADKEADKFIKEVLDSKDNFVNYNESSYSVPTGEFPKDHIGIRRHDFNPEDSIIANKYLEKQEVSKPEEKIIDFISESSII